MYRTLVLTKSWFVVVVIVVVIVVVMKIIARARDETCPRCQAISDVSRAPIT